MRIANCRVVAGGKETLVSQSPTKGLIRPQNLTFLPGNVAAHTRTPGVKKSDFGFLFPDLLSHPPAMAGRFAERSVT